MGGREGPDEGSDVSVFQRCKGTNRCKAGSNKRGSGYTRQIKTKSKETSRKLLTLPSSPGSPQEGAKKDTARGTLKL